ncbi:glycoside hydrolase family 97 protein [Autumnicola psychrophila]|uniref:Glycoside hydrolase family 97 N-terminal domain-containing protein n=1 Tax=Autumnicola psychrophila TaxID=3075592 RepID=A0ABU3DM03_9FLAO|nr:glycoside hydrolase family 97 N-terminal domain-containing protein [Zunongwangia sp. F225]MDT0684737.1 glycoside hydrolase family 97 N-terminal domain-containing protein [Zunongwangia sp. F225]
MKLSIFTKSVLFFLICGMPLKAQEILPDSQQELSSPDGSFNFKFYQKEIAPNKKQMYYQINYNNKPVILESELGVFIENQLFESALAITNDTTQIWSFNLEFKNVTKSKTDTIWKPVYGENSQIRNNYNELILHLEKYGKDESEEEEGHAGTSYDRRRTYEMDIVVRAYDEGIAFRYHFPETNNGLFLHITGEQTNFALPEGTMAWYERWAQGPYEYLPLKNWPDESERPLTLKLENGLVASLTEARMVDYSRTKFKLSEEEPNTLETSMYDVVDVITPYSTPWRVFMAAENPAQLLENNEIILNLNPENQIEDTWWIKPGKAFRSNLTTGEGKAAVDFAAVRNLQYVHFDAGWYGPEMKVSSDATTIDENRDLDLEEVIYYGAQKGIGVFVYVNQRALAKQNLDTLFSIYRKWGLKGIKFGFVQVGSNHWTRWMHDAVKKAAEYELMVDIHDEYRPTGFSRTYPNLMTQEGIRGNEEMPDATHNTILPFTRYLAGAGDYTIAYYNNRIQTTHAHQLALAAVYYSPIQYMYWYDTPSHYQGEKEIEFFDKVKTVWDETKVINGKIGEYATVARRSGSDWFIGTITNNDGRRMEIPLDFIEKEQDYIAHIYVDDEKVKSRTAVNILRYKVSADDVLKFDLKASGGAAVHLEKLSRNNQKNFKKLPKKIL